MNWKLIIGTLFSIPLLIASGFSLWPKLIKLFTVLAFIGLVLTFVEAYPINPLATYTWTNQTSWINDTGPSNGNLFEIDLNFQANNTNLPSEACFNLTTDGILENIGPGQGEEFDTGTLTTFPPNGPLTSYTECFGPINSNETVALFYSRVPTMIRADLVSQ